MKKIAIIVVLALAATLGAIVAAGEFDPDTIPEVLGEDISGEPAEPEIPCITGLVEEITENGYIIYNEEIGRVVVLTDDNTVFDTNGDIVPGDFIYADYSGMMSRSIPPQITAMRICMFRAEGNVTEYLPDENALMLETEEFGVVMARLSEDFIYQNDADAPVTVYFNGAMTMSLPAQISAGYVTCME